jgi:hypothetical protein
MIGQGRVRAPKMYEVEFEVASNTRLCELQRPLAGCTTKSIDFELCRGDRQLQVPHPTLLWAGLRTFFGVGPRILIWGAAVRQCMKQKNIFLLVLRRLSQDTFMPVWRFWVGP